MLEAETGLPSLPTATWLDETLCSARAANKVVAVRFGRTADPLCQRCDALLREASSSLDKLVAEALSIFTVDIDEVPEFTFMYELYDPFTVIIFHRSKPLLLDAGHGPTRKITELPLHGPQLTELLATAVRAAVEDMSPATVAAPRGQGDSRVGADAPDDAATWNEEATRYAGWAKSWLSGRAAPVLEKAMPMLARAEESMRESAQQASERGKAALEAARVRVLTQINDSLGAEAWHTPPPSPEAKSDASAPAPPPVPPKAAG